MGKQTVTGRRKKESARKRGVKKKRGSSGV